MELAPIPKLNFRKINNIFKCTFVPVTLIFFSHSSFFTVYIITSNSLTLKLNFFKQHLKFNKNGITINNLYNKNVLKSK